MAKLIVSRVEGFETIPWADLKTYEFNDLKEVEGRDVSRLKNAIVNDGFCFPLEVWAGHRYVIDGRGRDAALRELESEGYEIPDIPVTLIKAPTKEAAKRMVLMRASQHGRLTQESFERFTGDMDVSKLDAVVSLHNIDLGMVDSEIGDTEPPEDFETFDGEESKHQCPNCGHEFS
jgi:hypothetical protein